MAANERFEGTFEVNKFRGLRNTVPPERFEKGDLAVATNVDIDDSMQLLRRRGYALVDAASYNWIWSDGVSCLTLRTSGTLSLLKEDEDEYVLRTGLSLSVPPSAASMYAGGPVYFVNPTHALVVDNGSARKWGIDVPTSNGTATSDTDGLLRGGTYRYAVVYVASDGQRSGALPASVAVVGSDDSPGAGGFTIAGLPYPNDTRVVALEIYISDVGGEKLYWRGLLPIGATEFRYREEIPAGAELFTQFMGPPPPNAHLVATAYNRTLVAVDDALYISEPFSHELFDYRKAFRMGSRITMLAVQDDGVYLGTDQRVVWFAGRNPEEWVMSNKLAYGAIPGTLSVIPGDWLEPPSLHPVLMFMTTQGMVAGRDGGQISNVTEDRFLFPAQQQGVSAIRKHRGMNQFLVILKGTETAPQAAAT